MGQKKLFLIEPNTDIGESLSDLFTSEGHEVFHSTNIEDLVNKASFQEFDIILADTGSNCEINRSLAKRHKKNQIDCPILVIACYCVYNNENIYIRMGLDGVHAKPLDFEILLKQVADIVQNAGKKHLEP